MKHWPDLILLPLRAGPHSLRPDLIPNFTKKWNIVMPLMFAVATAAPALIVTYQQWKLKA